MKYQIKHQFSNAVLFEAELSAEFDTASETRKMGAAVRIAVRNGADLRGAYLGGAYLSGAYLSGVDLGGAYLSGAYLRGAYLSGAYLSGAYLSGADLGGAYLSGAYLSGAIINGHKIVSLPLFLSPIGSEAGTLEAWRCEDGVFLRRGCFFGGIDEFAIAVEKKHSDNEHGRVYRAAIAMIREWARGE